MWERQIQVQTKQTEKHWDVDETTTDESEKDWNDVEEWKLAKTKWKACIHVHWVQVIFVAPKKVNFCPRLQLNEWQCLCFPLQQTKDTCTLIWCQNQQFYTADVVVSSQCSMFIF